jgi:hypothetical protein
MWAYRCMYKVTSPIIRSYVQFLYSHENVGAQSVTGIKRDENCKEHC